MDTAFHGGRPRPPDFGQPREFGPAFINQIKTNVGGAIAFAILARTVSGQLDGALRDVRFRKFTLPGQKFDRMPVTIAGRKIHRVVNPGGIAAQNQFDLAQVFHELFPVHGAQETEAGDTVADGDLVGGLILGFQLDELLDGQAELSQPLFEPAAREMQHRALPRQPLAEFRHEGTGQGQIRFRHVSDHDDEMRWIFLRHFLQPVHPQIR